VSIATPGAWLLSADNDSFLKYYTERGGGINAASGDAAANRLKFSRRKDQIEKIAAG
jgi:hypothetical protein